MAKVSFTQTLSKEYENLFNGCLVRPERMDAVESIIAKLQENKDRYQNVGGNLSIPWFFVAVIHNMESGLNFNRHLHNGDPLSKRTVNVPAGRPKKGKPPFTWEESASDALTMKGLERKTDWSLAGTLYQLERYNGWGYRLYHSHVLSPYLWSFSNHYRSGKYISDGTWSDVAVSKQCGAAVLLRRMAELDQIDFPDQPGLIHDAALLICHYAMTKSEDQAVVTSVEELQRWLNTFPGIFVKIDGIPGNRTSEAYKRVTGFYLPGDPRA